MFEANKLISLFGCPKENVYKQPDDMRLCFSLILLSLIFACKRDQLSVLPDGRYFSAEVDGLSFDANKVSLMHQDSIVHISGSQLGSYEEIIVISVPVKQVIANQTLNNFSAQYGFIVEGDSILNQYGILTTNENYLFIDEYLPNQGFIEGEFSVTLISEEDDTMGITAGRFRIF